MAKNSKAKPAKTMIGPNVNPKNPKPNSVLSRLMIKKPVKIMAMPANINV